MKLQKAAQNTAVRGFITRVETMVAYQFAASMNAVIQSKIKAMMIVTIIK